MEKRILGAAGVCKLLSTHLNIFFACVKQQPSVRLSLLPPPRRMSTRPAFLRQQLRNPQQQQRESRAFVQQHLTPRQRAEAVQQSLEQQQQQLPSQQQQQRRTTQLTGVEQNRSQGKNVEERADGVCEQLPLRRNVGQLLFLRQGAGCAFPVQRRRYSSSSAAAAAPKKKKKNSRQRAGGKKKLIEKERVIKNPFKYESKRDGIELVRKGKIFSPEAVKDGHHLAVLLVALQKFGFAADKALLFRYAERAHTLSPQLYPKAAALILNVLARQQLLHVPLLQSLSSRLVPRLLRHANAQDLALLVHAFAAFRWPDPSFFAAAAEEIPHKLPFFEPQHLVAVAQAIAKLSCSGSSSISGSSSSFTGGEGGKGGATAMAAEQHALLLDDIAEETLRKLSRFNARATALIAAALGSAAAAAERERRLLLTSGSPSPSPSLGATALSPVPLHESFSPPVSSTAPTAAEGAASAVASRNAAAADDLQVALAPESARRGARDAAGAASSVVRTVSTAAAPSSPLPAVTRVDDGPTAPAAASVPPFFASKSRCLRPLFWDRLLEHAFSLREEMDAAELIKVATGAANAHAQQHQAFAGFLSSRLLETFDVLPVPLLSQLFNACAKWGYYDRCLFAALSRRFTVDAAAQQLRGTAEIAAAANTEKLETPDVACVGQLLHACGCLRHRDPLLLNSLAFKLYLHAVDAAAAYAAAAAHATAAPSGGAASDRFAAAGVGPPSPTARAIAANASPPAASTSALLPVAAATSSGWQASGERQSQQRDSEAAYPFMTQKQQHRVTPQTLSVTLRALYRLRWGSHEQQQLYLCSGTQPSSSSHNSSGQLGSDKREIKDRVPDTSTFRSEHEAWQKELVPLLAHLVLQQVHLFTPQGLCECTDALSGLLFRDYPQQQEQQQAGAQHETWQQRQHKARMQEQQERVEQQERDAEREVLQCDENILFYRLAEQLSRLWPLLSLQGVISIIRAFGRRGRKGDVPLVHRCVDRIRHAVRRMDMEECCNAKHAVAAALAYTVRGSGPTPQLLPLQTPPQQQCQQKQEQQGKGQPQQEDQQQQQRQPHQQDQQQEAVEQTNEQQQNHNMQGDSVQLQESAMNPRKSVAFHFDSADRPAHASAPVTTLLSIRRPVSIDFPRVAASSNEKKSVTTRPAETAMVHRLVSLAAAIDRRMVRLSLCTSAAPGETSNRAAAVAGVAAAAASSAAAAAAPLPEGASEAARNDSPASLRSRYAPDAAAAAAAAAKEEELAELLFNNPARSTNYNNIDMDAHGAEPVGLLEAEDNEAEEYTSGTRTELGVQHVEAATYENPTCTWVSPVQDGEEQQQARQDTRQQHQEREEEKQLQYGGQQQSRPQTQEPTKRAHTKENAATTDSAASWRGGAAEGAAAKILGDSLDTLLDWHRGAASKERDNNVRDSGSIPERIATSGIGNTSRSSGSSTRYSTTVSCEKSRGRRTGTSEGTSRLQQQQRPPPVDVEKKGTGLLAKKNNKQQQAPLSGVGGGRRMAQQPQLGESDTTFGRGDEEDDERPRMSMRELLRGHCEKTRQTKSTAVEQRSSNYHSWGTKQQNLVTTVEETSEEKLVYPSTTGGERSLRECMRQQQHRIESQPQLLRRRHQQQSAEQSQHQEEDEDVQHQQQPLEGGEAVEKTPATRGRRRWRCLRLQRQGENEQQESVEECHRQRTGAAAAEETGAVPEVQLYPLPASSRRFTPSTDTRIGRTAHQDDGAATGGTPGVATPAAAKAEHQAAKSGGTANAAAEKQAPVNGGARVAARVAPQPTPLGEDLHASRVDGTGLIVRNKQLRARAAAEGGYDTGYVDLAAVLEAAAPASTYRRQSSGSTAPAGAQSRSWGCTSDGAGDSSSLIDSGSRCSSSNSSSAHGSSNSINSLIREVTAGDSSVRRPSAGSVVTTGVPLFSAATGGRKSKRSSKK